MIRIVTGVGTQFEPKTLRLILNMMGVEGAAHPFGLFDHQSLESGSGTVMRQAQSIYSSPYYDNVVLVHYVIYEPVD